MEREPGTSGYQVRHRRWAVERSFAWLPCNHWLAKGYERNVQTSETLSALAMIGLLVARLEGRVP